MGGPAHQFGSFGVCVHWDEHPCALHTRGTCVQAKRTECLLDLYTQLSRAHQFKHIWPDSGILSMCFLCSYISSSPVGSYPDTLGTDKRVMKAVTVSLMKWGVNPPLIAGIFLVHILSRWQFPVRVPFQHQHQPPAVPALARRWLHHIVAPKGAKVDWPQVWCMSVLSYWTFGTFISMNFAL